MVDEIKTTESDRSPRSAESRDKVSRRKPWQPPSLLDAPTPPQGYVYRWIRESMIGQTDPANMSKRIREQIILILKLPLLMMVNMLVS